MKKKVLITGATSGIGLAISSYYRKKGFTVYDVSRSGTYGCDFSDPFNVARFIHTFDNWDQIDVLINNSGLMFLEESPIDFPLLYNVLLTAPALFLYRIGHKIRSHIVNIASVSGMKAEPDAPMYGALKAGLINLTKSYAIKLAPDVRVNCISPGFFNTNLIKGNTPDFLIKSIPIAREASPIEIIPVIKMLDESKYMTGANIVIDGGLTA